MVEALKSILMKRIIGIGLTIVMTLCFCACGKIEAAPQKTDLDSYVKSMNIKDDFKPQIGIVLGSGLHPLAEEVEVVQTIIYENIPGFPHSTVEGHEGKFILGYLEGVPVILMDGRVHYYEGYSMEQVVTPVSVMGKLGVETIILTNASGILNKDFEPGDLICINDHISSFIPNPLIGQNDDTLGERFVGMADAYDETLRKIAHEAADENGIRLRDGTYVQVTGPTYETPAEAAFYNSLGADIVGMSTVCETIALRHMGVKVLGISCATNYCPNVVKTSTNHEEVQENSEKASEDFIKLIKTTVRKIGEGGYIGKNENVSFEYWNEEAQSLSELKEYVKDVTDKSSSHYIPEEDRIAVFDMDGTLYGELAPIYIEWLLYAYRVNEDPQFIPDDTEKKVADQIVEAAKTGSIPENLEMDHAIQNARAFAGMTVEGYRQYVRDFCNRPATGFEGMTYKEAFYKPMIEVVDYLNDNGFTVYICSGTDRILCRELIDGVLAIEDNHVIGMDVMLKARGQGNADGLDYTFTSDDAVVRTDELLIKNVKMNKVSQLAQELGKQPVLSFGNSSGDESMGVYTTANNPYYSKAFMLIADDNERDYGNSEKALKRAEKWREHGWVVISMKDDFKTIYGDDVKKQ